MAAPSFGCGYFSMGALAEYTNLRILSGKYKPKTIFVFHACPEMPSSPCSDSSRPVDAFKVGDYHYLQLSHTNFQKLELLIDDGIKHPESMTFFAICAEPQNRSSAHRW